MLILLTARFAIGFFTKPDDFRKLKEGLKIVVDGLDRDSLLSHVDGSSLVILPHTGYGEKKFI